MSKAAEAILAAVNVRPQTLSELVSLGCRNGCRSIETARVLALDMLRKRQIDRYKNRNLDIWLYIPGRSSNGKA